MAPPQNMVISPLLKTWKKEGVPFKSQTRSTIQHPHCHLSLKEVSSKNSGWKADGLPYWVAWVMLGCLDAANHGWGFSNSGTEVFNFIINSLFDSVALRKRGFTAIRPHYWSKGGMGVKGRGPTLPLTLMMCVNKKQSFTRQTTFSVSRWKSILQSKTTR